MSASNEWDEWHLTPRGWIAGSQLVDFSGIHEKPIPPDRVVTYHFTSYMGHALSKVEYGWELQWNSGADPEPLYREFGRYPDGVEKYLER